MRKFDFIRSCLRIVDFDAVDPGSCSFPIDGEHLDLKNQLAVFEAARAQTEREWNTADRANDVPILDNLYLDDSGKYTGFISTAKKNMSVEVANSTDFRRWIGESAGERVFLHLCELTDQINK